VRRIALGGAAATLVSGLLALPLAPTGQAAPAAAASSAPPDSHFQKVTLNDRPGEPMDLAVLPNNDVLHTTRPGDIWLNQASTGVNRKVGHIDVYRHDEEGLQSIALDPGYNGRSNRWVYLYYSPPQNTPVDDPSTPGVNEGDAPTTGDPADFEPFQGVIRLSRFEYVDGRIDRGSEQQIIDVPVDRGICCHVGGDIVFDSSGNLLLATGDDTNPFSSGGYTPIDERPTQNPAFDAQRSSGNTNDLRGKILRIRPKAGGGYTIPQGNLFAPGTPRTRPEIYAMGLRNPFRIELDPRTDDLFVADYSPDARSASATRGPAGQGKWTVVRRAGNYGWPYCATAELPYVDYDFATGTSGETFDCAAPVNESPHNTGQRELPTVVQPDVWYSYDKSADFPELGTGGIGPMAGPAYRFDATDLRSPRPVAWPEHYDGMPLFYEWTRDYVKGMRLGADGALGSIESVVPGLVTDNPMDLEFGPNGALYVLEYGDGYFAENPDAQLSRIDYIGPDGDHSPVPAISADPSAGKDPLRVSFSSAGSADPDGDRLRYQWDFEGDGVFDSEEANPTWTYTEPGGYRATLTVTDVGGSDRGRRASADIDIVVGNQVPSVSLLAPVEGQPFQFGDTVAFEVQVQDDQAVDCHRVEVTYVLGHDTHGHPQTTASGCTGTIETAVPEGHDPAVDDLSAVFVAEYTDSGAGDVPALTGSDQVVLEAN
jgi:cytochrome c